MQKIKIFLTLTGYQVTWLACVFGEKNFSSPFIGFFVGLLFILIYFLFSDSKKKLSFVIISIAIPGYTFDSLLVYFSIYEFLSIYYIGALPIWMIVLWISFAILFDEIFVFLKNFKIISIIISSILGPVTYYIGDPIGILKIYNFTFFIIFMIIFWALLMFYYLTYVLKKII